MGSAANYVSHHRELSFELFFHDKIAQDNPAAGRSEWYYPRVSPARSTVQPIKQRYVEELNEDFEGIVETLEKLGVQVLRPLDLAASTAGITTPAWSAAMPPPLNIRDNTLILGTEIIETPPMIQVRYFESQLLKPVFREYFQQGARWTVMPRPMMTDASFDCPTSAATRWAARPSQSATRRRTRTTSARR